MSKRRVLLLTLLVLVLGGWKAWGYLKLHGLGLLSRIMDPIQANQEVKWEAGPATAPAGKRPPNVVVIVADDLGINDLSFAGGGVADGKVDTPNINSIASGGALFTQGYAANATCAPSRAAILTGRYPTRFGFEFTPAPKVFMRLVANMTHEVPGALRVPTYHYDRESQVPDMSQEGVPPSEITLAELLKTQGYRTVGLGKWHLGETPNMLPEAQGFDEFLGFASGASMYLDPNDPQSVNSVQDYDPIDTFLWANLPYAVRKNEGKRFAPNEYITDYLGKEAVKAIEANRNRPFFLYLAFNAPHTPLQALRSDYDALSGIQDHTLRVYAAMIRALDRNVGRVLDSLAANGLEENTLVFFVSDNGGAGYIGLPNVNQPYRGFKMTFFEGGVRSPFFVKWPAAITPGSKVAAPVSHIDILATAAAAAGAPLPTDREIDGVNLLPYARGENTGAPHEALFWRSGGYRTVIAGGWKLQVSDRLKKDWLFNLSEDPTERVDLAAKNPAKVEELKKLLAAHDAEQIPPAWPSLIEGPISVDHPSNVPEREDDTYIYWDN